MFFLKYLELLLKTVIAPSITQKNTKVLCDTNAYAHVRLIFDQCRSYEDVSIGTTFTPLHLTALQFFIYTLTLVFFISDIDLKNSLLPIFWIYWMATEPVQPFLYGNSLEQELYHSPTKGQTLISASPGKFFNAVMSHFSLGMKVSLYWVNICLHADISHSKSVNYAITFFFLSFFLKSTSPYIYMITALNVEPCQ